IPVYIVDLITSARRTHVTLSLSACQYLPFCPGTRKFIPKCIAPNLITFSGFLCMVVVVGFMYWFDYGFHAVDGTREYSGFRDGTMEYGIPNWCFGLCGVLVFLAYNLGPLGELFDHGLDSYIVFLIPFSIISIFGRDEEYSLPCFRGFLIVVSIVLNFYISHFEKYNTGTLYLPWGYDVSRMLTFFEAIRPLVSIVATTLTVVYWALHSENDIIEYDPRSFIFLYGTIVPQFEVPILYTLMMMALVFHLHYGVCVVYTCFKYGWNCLEQPQ
ncbi:Phosphatidyltransferase, partial [Operophtera brumata]